MLTTYVTSPVTREHLRSTPCWAYLDGYTNWLAERRYTPSLIQLYLFGIVPLGRWLESQQLTVEAFDARALERFRSHRAAQGQWRHTNGKIKAAFRGAKRFHEYLVHLGMVSPQLEAEPQAYAVQLDFERWMSNHRGVCERTLDGYRHYISILLDRLGDDATAYSAAALRQLLMEISKQRGHHSAVNAATAVRTFLRYLVSTGQCSSTLVSAIPSIANWRLAGLPSTLPAADVARLISSCAEQPLTARRDRAVLLLLWRLALRAGDIAAVTRGDVDWREGRIRFAGKNRQELWLPLAQDVGDALLDYLRNDRPDVDLPQLFLKSIAPVGPLQSQVVSWIVRRAMQRTGIEAPTSGAHLLRRSAASEMLRQGATLDQIGTVLRHANLQTTQLYAKVDWDLLSDVAAPWPSCVACTQSRGLNAC